MRDRFADRLKRRLFKTLKRQGIIDSYVDQGILLVPQLEAYAKPGLTQTQIEKAVKKAIPNLLARGIIIPDEQGLLFRETYKPTKRMRSRL